MTFGMRCLVMGLAMSSAPEVTAQKAESRAGKRALLSPSIEIPLARSAAPASVSATARVLALTDTGFVVAEEGSGTVTCIVNRSWPTSIEPHCFDAEAAETIMRMEIARTVLYHRGMSEKEADREIADGITSGRFRLPRRPAMSWMMSEGQKLVDDDGTLVGKWRPHIMIYYPFITSADAGFSAAPDMRVGMISDSGKATSNFMIIMPAFVSVGAAR